MINNSRIHVIVDMLRSGVLERYQQGLTNQFLPVDGQVALLHDKLTRWFKTKNQDELYDFMIDGVLLLEKVVLDSEAIRERFPESGEPKLAELTEEERRELILGTVAQEKTSRNEEVKEPEAEPEEHRTRKKVRTVRKPKRGPRPERGSSERAGNGGRAEPGSQRGGAG